jgi:hypothetical protein
LWEFLLTNLRPLGCGRYRYFQFTIALGGTIVLAVYAVNIPEIGGISGLQEKLPAETFKFLPTVLVKRLKGWLSSR